MKYLAALLCLGIIFSVRAQSPLPESFLDGKSVVLISNAPQARPSMTWKEIAETFHPSLVKAGGDPVAYYELESITLSEDVQQGYAAAFLKRQIKSIIILTRKANGQIFLHIAPFTQNRNLVPAGGAWVNSSTQLDGLAEAIVASGKGLRTKNLLALEVPEFLPQEGATATGAAPAGTRRFFARNPLNLDVFKLGIPLSSAVGEGAVLSSYRYDQLGRTPEEISAAQAEEKAGMEAVFKAAYNYQVEFLNTPKADADLLKDRIQFLLVKVEGKEGELMKSMGLPIDNPNERPEIVVKYYIRLIVRDELYIGPTWDAHPDWRVALKQFLENLSIKQ